MSYELTDLLSDNRLEKLFSTGEHPCALQLWILQISDNAGIENRIIYGRLLPYNFINNTWSGSDKDTSQTFDSIKASVHKLNLYISSSQCKELLTKVVEGKTIEEISTDLNLRFHSKKLLKKFGSTRFNNENVIYKPVAYLLNRDAHSPHTLTSPHGSAGALSASVIQNDKLKLLSVVESYDVNVIEMLINSLNTDTGMDFSKADNARLGDIELLIFPTLDEHEKSLLTVDFNRNEGVKILFESSQLPKFERFQFRLSVESGSQILYSSIVETTKNKDGLFTYTFDLTEKLFKSADSTYIEIFGFPASPPNEGFLCCRYKVSYVREMNFNIGFSDNNSNSVNFDWLDKTTNKKQSDRVVKALTSSLKNHASNTKIGGRKVDSWVTVNQQLKSTFKTLYPKKSKGQFFPRISESSGEGRLQFVEWFKGIIEKHHKQHITILDPYFEDAGLGLLTLYIPSMASCTVFRSIPKPIDPDKPRRRHSDTKVSNGINNLIANCNHHKKQLKNNKLVIYGMKEGSLHDRYILIHGQDGLPIEGFHLSNSFQKAAENYPLLITPIPTDVLYKVNQYAFDLVQKLNTSNEDNSRDALSLLFDSENIKEEATVLYEPLKVLDNQIAGDLLALWLEQPQLKGLSRADLKNKMTELGILENESLHKLEKKGFINCLKEIEGQLTNSESAWTIVGEILAYSPVGDDNLTELKSETKLIAFLSAFLSSSFQQEIADDEDNVSVIDPCYFNSSLKDCLSDPIRLEHFHRMVKHKCLTWAEFYTIKLLWNNAPELLIDRIEEEVSYLNGEFSSKETIRLSLLGQIINEISLSQLFGNVNDFQQKALLNSNLPFVRWLGWNIIEQKLQTLNDIEDVSTQVSTFSTEDQIQFYGWALNRMSKREENKELCKKIISKLHSSLPPEVLNEDLSLLIDSMRGHMNKLGWMELWQFNDIINPLLVSASVKFDDASKIWLKDLLDSLDNKNRGNSLLFTRDCEAKATNICAYLFAYSSSEQQSLSLQLIGKTLNKQIQIIQQPLASTTNWSKWNDALKVSLWIFAFTKWCEYYLNELGANNHCELNSLAEKARDLSMTRPHAEWATEQDLLSFIEEVDKLREEKTTS